MRITTLIISSFVLVTGFALADVAQKDAGAKALDGARDRTVERYVLPKHQAEALALLLRLDLPHDTTVTTEAPKDEPGLAVVVNGPRVVHDALRPFVIFLVREQSLRDEEMTKQRHEAGEEALKRASVRRRP